MELFIAVMLFVVSSMITPGPNNIMVMSSGLNFGVKRTLPHFLGICLGFPSMVIAIGLGLGTVFVQFPVLHPIIKTFGSLYMLYLAWHIATSSSQLEVSDSKQPLSFFQAVLFQWINPKAWVMSVGAISSYTVLNGHMTQEVLTISGTYLLFAFPCVGIWMLFGVSLKRFLTNQTYLRLFNYSMGALLLISILLMIFE